MSYSTPPSESVSSALASTKDVYGIRRLSFDHAARTLRVEYDATRLSAASVTHLVRQTGLEIAEVLPRASSAKAPKLTPAAR